MRSLAALSAFALLLSATPAHAAVDFRWPWEPPKQSNDRRDDGRQNRDDDRYGRDDRWERGPRQPGVQAASHDAEFVERMLFNTEEQLALARIAEHSSDPRIRAMARRTLQEAGALEMTLEQRARELGLRMRSRRPQVSLPRAGWELDLAYLRSTLDVIALERPYFADYKSSVGGAFHDALQRHWDDMVVRRDDVKRLHDEVRNAARRHGANV